MAITGWAVVTPLGNHSSQFLFQNTLAFAVLTATNCWTHSLALFDKKTDCNYSLTFLIQFLMYSLQFYLLIFSFSFIIQYQYNVALFMQYTVLPFKMQFFLCNTVSAFSSQFSMCNILYLKRKYLNMLSLEALTIRYSERCHDI